MSNSRPRVKIPKNPEELLALASKVYAKHTNMLVTSPLNALQSHTWEVNGPQLLMASAFHQQAEEASRMAEEFYRKRDLILEEIDQSVKSSRDLLLSIYSANPKELGQWGFEVDDSVRPAATPTV